MKLDISKFFDNLIVLSMCGGSGNVSTFLSYFNIDLLKDKTKIFYGLDTSDKFDLYRLKYDVRFTNKEIYSYSNMFTGTLGCHMNHFYAIHMALVNNYDYVVIMEDDVFPMSFYNGHTSFEKVRESFLEKMAECVNELPDDFECMNFGWIPSIVLNERQKTPTDYSLRLYDKLNMECSGAFGYLLSRNGIQKSLSLLSDLRMATDYQFAFMKSYYTREPLVGHPPANAYSRIRKTKNI